LQTSLKWSIISGTDMHEVRGRRMFGYVFPDGDLKRRHSRDNNALHTEPRAARFFCLQVVRRGPVNAAVITLR
jgi:hypothetical protein